MTTTPTKRKPAASRSGNPATAAAAKQEAAAKAAALKAEQEAAAAAVRRQFEELKLDAPVFDDDGFEIIPDKSALEGGSYKFKVKGQPFILPKLQYLPLALAQRLQTATSEADAQALILGRYAPELLDHAGADELIHVFKRWQDLSQGVGLGE